MTNKKNIAPWIVIGLVAGIAIVYLAVQKEKIALQEKDEMDGAPPQAQETLRAEGQQKKMKEEAGKALSYEVVNPKSAPAETVPQTQTPSAPTPDKTINIEMSAEGISPPTFTVKEGQVVKIVVSAKDSLTHIFKFRDPALIDLARGVSPDETRAVTFTTPKKGEYPFICDVPGHEARGETGTMIVK